ncbi:MAG: cytochrome c [Kiloniellales bacterium]
MRICRLATVVLLIAAASVGSACAQEGDAVARGEYVFRAGGGCSCHTDIKQGGAFLAGGRALKTPFGIFYSPNITPDRETGIGGWSVADFVRAMREGIGPDGAHYFPVFPYTSFTNATDGDLKDLKAYLDTVAPVRKRNRAHDVAAPFGWRVSVGPWKWLFFEKGPFRPEPGRSKAWNRGAYLATALAHCGECHTPRNALAGLDGDMWFAGTKDGPEGELAPNITPHAGTGIGRWSAADLAGLLKTGRKPDFDDVQGLMAEAIEQGYKYLDDADLEAIAEYVRSLPPIDNRVEAKSTAPRSPYE